MQLSGQNHLPARLIKGVVRRFIATQDNPQRPFLNPDLSGIRRDGYD